MLLLKLMVVLLLLRSAHLGAAAACSRVCAAGDGSMMGFPSRESAANAQRAWLTSHVAAVSMIADETRRRDVPLIASRRRPIYIRTWKFLFSTAVYHTVRRICDSLHVAESKSFMHERTRQRWTASTATHRQTG